MQEAARRLGVEEDAIRKRIQRGSMRHEKAEHGRVYVWVDAAQDAAQGERPDDLQEQLGYLRRQLDEEREALRRADTTIARLARANEEQARTIRELEVRSEPPPDERESPEGSGATAGRGEIWEELDTERARRETAETTLHEGMAEERRRREAAERERDELRRKLYGTREGRESAQKADEQQGRGYPNPLRSGLRGQYGGRGGVGCSATNREVAMEWGDPEFRAANERITAMAEELRKAELVRDRLEGLDRLMGSYPEGHDMRTRLEALHVDRALEGVNEEGETRLSWCPYTPKWAEGFFSEGRPSPREPSGSPD
jgi:hypothetical protein